MIRSPMTPDEFADQAINAVLHALADKGYIIIKPGTWHESFFEGHEDDGSGGCIRCRFYIPHTDDEYTIVPFPCLFAIVSAQLK